MSDTKRIIRFHAKGMKVKDIAKRVGCSYHGAYTVLRKAGLLKVRKYMKRAPLGVDATFSTVIHTLEQRLKGLADEVTITQDVINSIRAFQKHV